MKTGLRIEQLDCLSSYTLGIALVFFNPVVDVCGLNIARNTNNKKHEWHTCAVSHELGSGFHLAERKDRFKMINID